MVGTKKFTHITHDIFLQLLLKKSRVLYLMGFRVFIQKRDEYEIGRQSMGIYQTRQTRASVFSFHFQKLPLRTRFVYVT